MSAIWGRECSLPNLHQQINGKKTTKTTNKTTVTQRSCRINTSSRAVTEFF